MQSLQQVYSGLGLLVRLNVDRALFIGAITASIMTGAWVVALV